MQWTCQLVVKTGTPHEGELMVLLQEGSNFVSWGEFSTPTGWLDKPLSKMIGDTSNVTNMKSHIRLRLAPRWQDR